MGYPNIDGLVKSLKRPLSVIPAQAGIQSFYVVRISLDSRSPIDTFEDKFHGNDNFLRIHQIFYYSKFHYANISF